MDKQIKIPDGWEEKEFTHCYTVESFKKFQIKKEDFINSGNFPIIDQSQNFIAGYTNDENKVVSGKLPYLIFGDHTRIVKFINFKFSLGADGTQVLKNKRILDAKFSYYLLNKASLEIGNHGYDRHMKHLKRYLFKYPIVLKEQEKIASILQNVDENIEKTEQIIEKQKKIKAGLMHDLLTGKIRIKDGKKYLETNFNVVDGIKKPVDWEVKKLKEISKFVKDGTHGTHKDTENGIPLLSAKDIIGNTFKLPREFRTISIRDYESIHKNYEIAIDDILLTIVGTIGRSSIIKEIKEKFTFQRSVAIIRIKKEFNPDFIFQYINSDSYIRKLHVLVNASAQGGVYLGELNKTLISISKSKKEQQEIADVLRKQDQVIEKEEEYLEKLKKLKAGLMDDLLTGRKRVKF